MVSGNSLVRSSGGLAGMKLFHLFQRRCSNLAASSMLASILGRLRSAASIWYQRQRLERSVQDERVVVHDYATKGANGGFAGISTGVETSQSTTCTQVGLKATDAGTENGDCELNDRQGPRQRDSWCKPLANGSR